MRSKSTFLIASLTIIAVVFASSCSSTKKKNSKPVTPPPPTGAAWSTITDSIPTGRLLQEPPVLASASGVLAVDLTATAVSYEIEGMTQTVNGLAYNGLIQPPTLRLNAGDTLRLNLHNNLPKTLLAPTGENPSVDKSTSDHAEMAGFTNLHYHGLTVSPSGNSDNVFITIAPGQSQAYEVEIPSDHPTGMFWYHPHLHGISDGQVAGGMSGLIEIGDVSAKLPVELESITKRTIALRDLPWVPQPIPSAGRAAVNAMALNGLRLVNGQDEPTITIAPGETQLWRVANIGSDVPYTLTLGGATFWVIAEDGNPMPEMKPTTKLELPTARRFDVLVVGPPPGSTPLMTAATPFGGATVGAFKLANVRSEGEARTTPALPLPLRNPRGPITEAATVQRNFTLGVDKNQGYLLINGLPFDPTRIDTTVTAGAVEEWTIVNEMPMAHPFHIHVNDFQLLEVNGAPQPFDGMQDTVLVPSNGEVKFRIKFDPRFTGKFVYHCHILKHEDLGMMATINVVPPAA